VSMRNPTRSDLYPVHTPMRGFMGSTVKRLFGQERDRLWWLLTLCIIGYEGFWLAGIPHIQFEGQGYQETTPAYRTFQIIQGFAVLAAPFVLGVLASAVARRSGRSRRHAFARGAITTIALILSPVLAFFVYFFGWHLVHTGHLG
jgi:hypothetical protein